MLLLLPYAGIVLPRMKAKVTRSKAEKRRKPRVVRERKPRAPRGAPDIGQSRDSVPQDEQDDAFNEHDMDPGFSPGQGPSGSAEPTDLPDGPEATLSAADLVDETDEHFASFASFHRSHQDQPEQARRYQSHTQRRLNEEINYAKLRAAYLPRLQSRSFESQRSTYSQQMKADLIARVSARVAQSRCGLCNQSSGSCGQSSAVTVLYVSTFVSFYLEVPTWSCAR